jgi:hypothetical protein
MTLPDPSNAMPDDEYGFAETITEYPNAWWTRPTKNYPKCLIWKQ